MTDVSNLNVCLHNDHIGTISLLPGERSLFVFSDSYVNNPARPVLSLSFKNTFGELITQTKISRSPLPSFFSNLLPEGPMRDYLARQVHVNAKREFFLLAVLGGDLPGAISVRPDNIEGLSASSPENEIKKIPKNALRFSLAGVQLKFSALAAATGGLTIPAQGIGGAWIVKLPSLRFANVPENEFSMMSLASLIGMDVPEIKLVDIKSVAGLPDDLGKLEGPALAVKRFDRSETEPVHMEDFAQVFGVYAEDKYKGSYKNIAQVLWAETGEAGIVEFTRRVVFNALIGNADLHLKNWSLIYPDKRNAKLSPAYDFVATIAYLDDDNMALKLVKSKRRAELSLNTLSYLAAKAKLAEKMVLDAAKETVERFDEVWRREKKHLPLAKNVIQTVEKNVKTIELVGEVLG